MKKLIVRTHIAFTGTDSYNIGHSLKPIIAATPYLTSGCHY